MNEYDLTKYEVDPYTYAAFLAMCAVREFYRVRNERAARGLKPDPDFCELEAERLVESWAMLYPLDADRVDFLERTLYWARESVAQYDFLSVGYRAVAATCKALQTVISGHEAGNLSKAQVGCGTMDMATDGQQEAISR